MTASRTIAKLLGLVLTGLALFFVLRILAREWPEIASRIHDLRWEWLVLGFIGYSGYFVLRAHSWQRIVKLFGYEAGFRETGRAWFLSEFKRYVPGSIWGFLGRFSSSKAIGHPGNVVLAGLSLEVAFITVSSLLVGGAMLVGVQQLGDYRWLALAGVAILLILIHPRILNAIFRLGFRIIRKEPAVLTESLEQQLNVLVIYLAAWVAYGFGALFTSLAFTSLPSERIWEIFGGFVLAWAIGYVVLFAPLGLGVREAAVILLLGPIIGIGLAGLLAVATRLWIIVTELAWVSFSATWSKLRGGVIERVRNFLVRHGAKILLGVFIAMYVGYFSIFSIARHENLNSGRFDLGIMDQVVWNTSQGRILQLTDPYGTATIHRFSIHFDPLLALFAPLYWIWADPRLLLVLQSLALGLGAIPVYLIARERFGKGLSLTFSLAYLLFPAMQWANTFDFHAVKFAAPLLLAAFAAAERRAYRSFTVFSLLAIMAKEEVSLLVVMIGLWLLLKLKRKWVGVNTTVFAAIAAVIVIFFLIPSFNEGPDRRAVESFSQFGETPSEVVAGIVSHPRLTAQHIVNKQTLTHLVELLGPVGFLPVFAPLALGLAWPEFAINLLSNNPAQKTILFQYTSGITPFVFIAAILAAAWIVKKAGPFWDRAIRQFTGVSLESVLAALLVLSAIIGAWALSPLPGTKQDFSRVVAWKNKYVPIIREERETIPADASVSVTNTFGSHFSRREHLYSFPAGADIADYVIALEGGVKEIVPKEQVSAAVSALRENPNYEVIAQEDRLTVFKRKRVH